MLRACVIFLIGLYQRHLSPHKGFRCAHAAYHGGPSCSNAIKDIVREHGVFAGWSRVRLRFIECRAAYISLSTEPDRNRRPENDRKPRRRRRRKTGSCEDAAADGACECACDGLADRACDAPCDVGNCH